MIREIPMYVVVCDRCGKNSGEDFIFLAWHTQADAIHYAKEEDFWIELDGKHYCEECYDFDDVDEIFLKP